ncbi:MAG: c-type cytochrome [Gammaproteobacteria bacterium]|nr:c-type cytochrome [Gammaproteobacteria bacterium]
MKSNVIYGVLLLLFLTSLPWMLGNFAYDDENDVVPTIIHVDPFYISKLPAQELIHEPLQPVTEPRVLNNDKVALGHKLFQDKRLSPEGNVSCDTCHALNRGGVDGKSHAIAGDATRGRINTPSIYNSANNFRWYWDGRATTLEAQVDESITSLTELGAEWHEVLSRLASLSEYQQLFSQLYPANRIQKEHVIDALAEFERSLVTPGAAFDRYLFGDEQALSVEQRRGYQLFKSYGCIACHQGGNVGGNMFQLFGVMGDFFADRKVIVEADLGRFNVTGKEDDKYRFRVPSLRNVALTAPYFHDGTADTLEQAVMVMANFQLGRPIPLDDAQLIVKFLHSLSGVQHGDE